MQRCDALVDALMQRKSKVHFSQLADKITAELRLFANMPPLGESVLEQETGEPIPFAVPADADRAIAAVHHNRMSKWGSVETAFRSMDKNGDGTLDQPEFATALRRGLQGHYLSNKELKELFADADADASGKISYSEFASAFGKGTLHVPEFLKPRSIRQSRGGPIWQWHQVPQASSASRKFEILDPKGHKRFHCKPCHMYLLASAFSANNIAQKLHLCKTCADAVAEGCEPGRHTRSDPRTTWPRGPPKMQELDNAAIKSHKGLGCVMSDTPIHHFPWATDTSQMFASCKPDQIKII